MKLAIMEIEHSHPTIGQGDVIRMAISEGLDTVRQKFPPTRAGVAAAKKKFQSIRPGAHSSKRRTGTGPRTRASRAADA